MFIKAKLAWQTARGPVRGDQEVPLQLQDQLLGRELPGQQGKEYLHQHEEADLKAVQVPGSRPGQACLFRFVDKDI